MHQPPTHEERELPAVPKSAPKGGSPAMRWVLLALLVVAVAGGAIALWLWSRPPETIPYRDLELPVLEGVARNVYSSDGFSIDERGWIHYEKNGVKAAQGIDVSYYQGEIDWQAVADSGIEFAILRLGYRGYVTGALKTDSTFQQNLEGAIQAGLDVGVYFFSQATTVLEAEAEADYVLEAIRGYPIRYPVVFDWEFIQAEEGARTDEMDGETLTQCAQAFCDLVSVAGYTPMVYFNQEMGYLFYRLDQLDDHPFWLADYQDTPGFYYDFAMWQYTHQGQVPGIEGNVDMNLCFRSWDRAEE